MAKSKRRGSNPSTKPDRSAAGRLPEYEKLGKRVAIEFLAHREAIDRIGAELGITNPYEQLVELLGGPEEIAKLRASSARPFDATALDPAKIEKALITLFHMLPGEPMRASTEDPVNILIEKIGNLGDIFDWQSSLARMSQVGLRPALFSTWELSDSGAEAIELLSAEPWLAFSTCAAGVRTMLTLLHQRMAPEAESTPGHTTISVFMEYRGSPPGVRFFVAQDAEGTLVMGLGVGEGRLQMGPYIASTAEAWFITRPDDEPSDNFLEECPGRLSDYLRSLLPAQSRKTFDKWRAGPWADSDLLQYDLRMAVEISGAQGAVIETFLEHIIADRKERIRMQADIIADMERQSAEKLKSLNLELDMLRPALELKKAREKELHAEILKLKQELRQAQPTSAPESDVPGAAEAAETEAEAEYLRGLVAEQADELRQARAQLREARRHLANGYQETVTAGEEDAQDEEDLLQWCIDNDERIVVLPRARNGAKKSEYEDPTLMLTALKLLAGPYRELRSGELKREQFDAALAEHGLKLAGAVGPSVAGEQGDAYFVKWGGQRHFLDLHLLKGGGREPRYCFRMYFFWDDVSQRAVVGSMPAHLGNSLT